MNRRHLLPRLALLGLLLVPSLASAQAKGGASGNSALGPSLGSWSGALSIGLDIPGPAGLDVGPRFSGEVMLGLSDITPQLRADVGFRASFAYHNADFGSEWMFDMVPDMRLLYAASPKLAIYGDIGIGLGIIHASDNVGGSATDTVAVFELAPGVSYALSPTVNLLAEIRFHFYTGGDRTFITLPTVKLQFR